jgi:hypothetical protein
MLAVSVTAAGPDGDGVGARNAVVTLRDPDGRVIPFITDATGRQAVLLPNPRPGQWQLRVEHDADASVDAALLAMKPSWLKKLQDGVGWFSCKTCKMMMRTLIISTMVHIGALGAAGIAAGSAAAVLAGLKPAVIEILKQAFLFAPGGVPQFISICLEYVDKPVGRALTAVCGWLKLC